MVGKDCDQRVPVLRPQQVLDRAGGKLGECLIGRREHRERAVALERVDQPSRFQRGRERVELPCRNGDVDDVGRLAGCVVTGVGSSAQSQGRDKGDQCFSCETSLHVVVLSVCVGAQQITYLADRNDLSLVCDCFEKYQVRK